jgi:tRNA (uracil-5-)-methyltransferase TRM9
MDQVYNAIAADFSRTRYKVWPKVAAFLDSLHPAATVLEIGCGNGKNMVHRPDLSMKGLDITEGFLEICRERGLHVAYGDATAVPECDNTYDAVLSIAVIHHLPTRSERRAALQEIARVLKPQRQALVSVWAAGSEEPYDRLVPFKTPTQTVDRFYHFYTRAELQEDLEAIVGSMGITWVLEEERGNWYAVLKKGPQQPCSSAAPHEQQASPIEHDTSGRRA